MLVTYYMNTDFMLHTPVVAIFSSFISDNLEMSALKIKCFVVSRFTPGDVQQMYYKCCLYTHTCRLTHLCLVDYSVLINWIRPIVN